MTTAQVVKTSVTVNNNSPILDYIHPDTQTQPTFKMTAGFKSFTEIQYLWHKYTFQRVLNQIPGGGRLRQATPSVLNENSRGGGGSKVKVPSVESTDIFSGTKP